MNGLLLFFALALGRDVTPEFVFPVLLAPVSRILPGLAATRLTLLRGHGSILSSFPSNC